ncbi:MAG: CocE/NonD family hydrolase [Proteobacteria bacterium]|nr:CocE/NonD family hydrolase [Pseudomonadota bacterium]
MPDLVANPRAVREIEHLWIPLADGTRLAARMWLPEDAHDDPVPAILEYIPYRKRDGTRARDESLHLPIAEAGYAVLRVDLRGTGDSEGVCHDEYLPQEQQDGFDVIAWIAAQPWCDGKVGMIGKSWGGFNGLQIAAMRPPALKAVVSVGSTDDRYATDVHYYGGALTKDNLDWSAYMFALGGMPPDPELVGQAWRPMWLERLEAIRPLVIPWLEHQRRDDYWRQGSVCEDFGKIEAACFLVNGWGDNYSEAITRMLGGLTCPRKGLIGPWAHIYPHDGRPGPTIGFLQECLRWWDHWLKGIDTGIMDEPMLRAWMCDSRPPRTDYASLPGRWVAEATWPSPRIAWQELFLNPGRLEAGAGPETPLPVCSMQTTGLTQGELGRYGEGGEWPGDQREDDGASLVFVTEPLAERIEIMGAPLVELILSSDRPVAQVAVRLNDVAPDGASTRVHHGVLNLTRRNGMDRTDPLEPGRPCRVTVEIDDIAHSFAPGHRIALSLSSTNWPLLWPSPEVVTLTVHAGTSRLRLPVRPPDPADADLPLYGPPVGGRTGSVIVLREAPFNTRDIRRDAYTGETVVRLPRDEGAHVIDAIAMENEADGEVFHRIVEGDPTSAQQWSTFMMSRRRGDWKVVSHTSQRLTCTAEAFRLEATIAVEENGVRIFERTWDRTIPRDGI